MRRIKHIQAGSSGALSVWAGSLLVVALLLYLRPYLGIRHDSVLYLGQALLRWKPEQFGQDLFFVYGSQAQFTVFPQAIALLLSHFDPAGLFLALALLGRLVFAVASFILIRQLFPPRYHFWALLALLIMPTIYGGYHVFSYGETFTTGRIFAEPLALLALAAFVRQRLLAAASLWLLAAMIHPLQAFPALLLSWLWLLLHDRRWLHLLWLPAMGLLLGLIGISPFSMLLTRYDPQWLEWIWEANKNVYVTRWEAQDWCYLLTDLFFAWMLFQLTQGRLKKFSKALMLSTVMGFAASILLVDMLQMVWPAGLQMWRIQWLLHWLAMAAIPYLLHHFYQLGPEERPRLLMLIAIAALGTPVGPAVPPWAAIGLIPLFLCWPKVRNNVRPVISRLLMAVIALALLLAFAKYALVAMNRFVQYGSEWNKFRLDLALIFYPLLSGSLVAAGLWLWQRGSRATHAALTIMLAAWTVYAASFWDRRNDWSRAIESASSNTSVFGAELRPGAQVYWEDELLAPWLILQRPSYFNNEQTAGLLFNRGTAREAILRKKVLDVLGTQTYLCNIMNTLNQSNDSCMIDDTAVQNACQESEGGLDYLVLRNPLKSKTLGSWTVLTEEKKRPVTYYLYQCRDFALTAKAQPEKSVDYQKHVQKDRS